MVRECISLYFKCWQLQNELFHSEYKQLEMLKQQSNKMKDRALDVGGNVRHYVEVHLVKENAGVMYLREQIRNVQELLKNNKTHDGDNIRKYLF